MGLQGSSQAQLPLVNQNELGVMALCRVWLLLHCSKMGLSYHHMSSFLPLIKIVYEVSTQSNSVSFRFDTASRSIIVNQHLDSVHHHPHPRTEESKRSRPGPAL